jgi:hypothetical protein
VCGAADSIEKLAPDNAFLMFKVRSGEDLVRKWRTTGYYAIWRHKELQQTTGMIDQQVGTAMQGPLQAFGLSGKDLADLFRRQFGFVLQPAPAGQGTGLEYVLLLEAGENGANILGRLGEQMKAMSQGADPFVEHAGVKVLRIPNPMFAVGAAAAKDFLVLASPFSAATSAVDRLKSPSDKAFSAGKVFGVMGPRLGRDSDVLLICDLKAVLQKLQQMQIVPPPVQNIVDVLGVSDIQALGGSFSISSDGIYFKGFLHVPGEKRGLLKLLAPTIQTARAPAPAQTLAALMLGMGLSPTDRDVQSPEERRKKLEDIVQGKAPIADTTAPEQETKPSAARAKPKSPAVPAKPEPAIVAPAKETPSATPSRPAGTGRVQAALHLGESVPPDVAQFSSYRINAPEAWQTLLEILDAVQKPIAEDLRSRAQEVATKAGKTDFGELLEELGSRVLMYTRYTQPYAEKDSQQTVIFIEVKDHEAFEALLAALRKEHADVFPSEAGDEVNGKSIYSVKLPNVPLPMSYCVTDRYLALGSGGNALQDYLRQAGKKAASLAEQARFKSALQKLPPEESRTMFQFSDPRPVIEWMVANVKAGRADQGPLQMLPMLAPVIQGIKNVQNPSELAKLVPPQVSSIRVDDEGIAFMSYQPLRGDK